MLIEVEPNLAPLEEWLADQLEHEALRWSTLSQRIRNELWRNVQLSQVIRKHRREGRIVASSYSGRFSETADPILSLSKK
jgi:hypothetical protein